MGAFERRRSRKNEKRKAKRRAVAAAKASAPRSVCGFDPEAWALREMGYDPILVDLIDDTDLAFERGYEGDV